MKVSYTFAILISAVLQICATSASSDIQDTNVDTSPLNTNVDTSPLNTPDHRQLQLGGILNRFRFSLDLSTYTNRLCTLIESGISGPISCSCSASSINPFNLADNPTFVFVCSTPSVMGTSISTTLAAQVGGETTVEVCNNGFPFPNLCVESVLLRAPSRRSLRKKGKHGKKVVVVQEEEIVKEEDNGSGAQPMGECRAKYGDKSCTCQPCGFNGVRVDCDIQGDEEVPQFVASLEGACTPFLDLSESEIAKSMLDTMKGVKGLEKLANVLLP